MVAYFIFIVPLFVCMYIFLWWTVIGMQPPPHKSHSAGLFWLQITVQKRPCLSEPFPDRKLCFVCQIAIVPLPWDNWGVYIPAERLDRPSVCCTDIQRVSVFVLNLPEWPSCLLPGCHCKWEGFLNWAAWLSKCWINECLALLWFAHSCWRIAHAESCELPFCTMMGRKCTKEKNSKWRSHAMKFELNW